MHHRISRLLTAAIIISIVFHFTIGPLLVWLLHLEPHIPKPVETVYVASSSALRIQHRTQPRKPHRAVKQPPVRPVQQPRAQTRPQPVKQPVPRQPEIRHEIAHFDRRSIHPPPAHSFALNAPEQQAQFEKTIARLRQENDPVIGAARSNQTPAARKRYTYDFSGTMGDSPQAEGVLTPEKSWHDEGYDYYYVRYWVQYADGSVETGIVPWPLRYLPAQDPFRLGIEHFPLPGPMPDYTLPPGTALHPLVAFCYKHRTDFDFCPIYHD